MGKMSEWINYQRKYKKITNKHTKKSQHHSSVRNPRHSIHLLDYLTFKKPGHTKCWERAIIITAW
jgi:hypothetical protein